MSPKHPEKEVAVVLAALGTPIKPKKKRKRQTPLYFKTGKSIRIKQGKSQIHTRTLIII